MRNGGWIVLGVATLAHPCLAGGPDCPATELVSVGTGSSAADDYSWYPVLSGDGRFVAFQSWASNLVASDPNGRLDVFVRDRVLDVTELVSVDWNGGPTNGNSMDPAISTTGRFVAFGSLATDVAVGATNGTDHVFVRDRQDDVTEHMSVAMSGLPDGRSWKPDISANGLRVVFQSYATNLVPGDTNGKCDIYLRDRASSQTTRISLGAGSQQPTHNCFHPRISALGNVVIFSTNAPNLVAGDDNDAWDHFAVGLDEGTIEMVSVTDDEVPADGGSGSATVSTLGTAVCFSSRSRNLLGLPLGDEPPGGDPIPLQLYLRDLEAGTTTLITTAVDGGPANGDSRPGPFVDNDRYVYFLSLASDLVHGDANGSQRDLFRFDRLTGRTTRIPIGNGGEPDGTPFAPSVTEHGTVLAFHSDATNLLDGPDPNGETDIFVRTPVCHPVDLDCDGRIRVEDLVQVIGHWGACDPDPWGCAGDVDGNHVVDVNDLAAVIEAWGACE